jgi:hypothetical protein
MLSALSREKGRVPALTFLPPALPQHAETFDNALIAAWELALGQVQGLLYLLPWTVSLDGLVGRFKIPPFNILHLRRGV